MIDNIKKGISSNLIALLLSTYIIISCMYIYCPDLIIPVSLLIFVIQALVFSFYTYLSGKSMLLRFVSVLGSFAGILGMVYIAIKTGQNKSSYDYFIWFLSPQALVTFSRSYIIATFIIINFFISSTIYYFSAVRYRLSMTFLITLIPFAFYRKEGARVPALVAFVLLALYIILMVHCRNINTKSNQKMIVDKGYKKSILYFLAAASLITFILPKPEVNFATSVWLSTVLDSDKLSDYMLERLGIVSTTSSSYTIYTNPTNTHMYTFTTDELPLNMKSQTFSSYDSRNNSWSVIPEDIYGSLITSTNAEYLDPGAFYMAVASAADKDSEFAEKYDLEEISMELPYSSERKIAMTYGINSGKNYITPTLCYYVRNADQNQIYRAPNGMLYNDDETGKIYSLSFYSGKLAEYDDYKKILTSLNMSDFEEFITELKDILGDDSEYSDTVDAYLEDYRYAKKYLDENTGNISPRISKLAEEIVKGRESDYQKATALQNYFMSSDFVYDMNYQKSVDYDIETFLFDDKAGVCGDFATAMTIMARSVGLPARYAEGVHLSESESGIVFVTDADLHAFPEVYISGYGWMTFEPTQAPLAEKSWWSRFAINIAIVLGALILIVFIVIFYVFYFPALSEKLFEGKLKKKTKEESVSLIGRRIRKKFSVSESASSNDVCEMIREKYDFDIFGLFDAYDSVVYGNNNINEEEYKNLYSKYQELIVTEKEYNKRSKKNGR